MRTLTVLSLLLNISTKKYQTANEIIFDNYTLYAKKNID